MLQCGFVRANLAFPISCGFLRKREHDIRQNAGAGDGNRTHVASLEGWSSTIELHPPEFASSGQAVSRAPYSIRSPLGSRRSQGAGGGGRIRTYVGIRRQIYSLLPLTTRPPLRDACRRSRSLGAAARANKRFPLVCQHAELRCEAV